MKRRLVFIRLLPMFVLLFLIFTVYTCSHKEQTKPASPYYLDEYSAVGSSYGYEDAEFAHEAFAEEKVQVAAEPSSNRMARKEMLSLENAKKVQVDSKYRQSPTYHRSENPTENEPQEQTTSKRLIVYSANIGLEVLSIKDSKSQIEEYTNQVNGFIEASTNNSITIRVPAEKFESTLSLMKEWGHVQYKNIFTQDVTDSFVDIVIRLENAKQVKVRLEKMLELAQSVEESVKIQKELARLQETIQALEDQLSYMSDLISYSTLIFNFTESFITAGNVPNPFYWLQNIGIQTLLNAN